MKQFHDRNHNFSLRVYFGTQLSFLPSRFSTEAEHQMDVYFDRNKEPFQNKTAAIQSVDIKQPETQDGGSCGAEFQPAVPYIYSKNYKVILSSEFSPCFSGPPPPPASAATSQGILEEYSAVLWHNDISALVVL